jgi:hypothetical protein
MLSEVQTDGSAIPSPPPLGRLLIAHGFLTEEQLQVGLAEHGRTGLPLGQVLIGLGFVTKAVIAQALATQAGGLVKTEYGFSTGFASSEPATAPLQFAGLRTPEAVRQPADPAPQAQADVIPLRQDAAPDETPLPTETPAFAEAALSETPADVAPAQVEAPDQTWAAPPEVTLPIVPAPAPAPATEVQPEPVAQIQPEPDPVAQIQPEPDPVAQIQPEPGPVAQIQPEPDPVAQIQPEPDPVAQIQPEPDPVAEIEPEPEPVAQIQVTPTPVEQAEAALTTAAARIDELQGELREQQRLTEASEAKLAEIALDAEIARHGLNAAVQELHSLRQEVEEARRTELGRPEQTPARELQVVRMELASMRNELTTVVEALRAVHLRLGEHSTTAPAPPVPDAPAAESVYQLGSS